MDRVEQVNWLQFLGGNIAANLGEGTAEELVEYALSDEGRESWGIGLPDWFDNHDRGLLIGYVAANLSDDRPASELSLEELGIVVLRESAYGDPDDSLMDWLANGDLDGMTVQDVIGEWDSDRD